MQKGRAPAGTSAGALCTSSPAAREERARARGAEHFPLPPLWFLATGKPGGTCVLVPGAALGPWAHNRLQIGAVSWSNLLSSWHVLMVLVAFPGPCGFSSSEAPRWGEMCSSCLSDPQVKDEDKSLAVKRPGKEDGAVSVAGHGQGGAVLGMGHVLSEHRPCARIWGHHRGS